MKRNLFLTLLAIGLCLPSYGQEMANGVAGKKISESDIVSATCSLYAKQVLGYSYDARIWENGSLEDRTVGSRSNKPADRTVRAIALGKEQAQGQQYYVFITLRSFVDPFYPSPVIQDTVTELVDGNNEKVSFDFKRYEKFRMSTDAEKIENNPYIRYGFIQFSWHKDVGGIFEVLRKVEAVTDFDHDTPKKTKWGYHPKEEYNGGEFYRPHSEVSVKDHFQYQNLGGQDNITVPSDKQRVRVRFYENHDVVLLYLPVKEDTPQIPTLGLENPTLAIDLALRRSENIFGFKFNLVGVETFEKIQSFSPKGAKLSAVNSSVLMLAGLALDQSTFNLFLRVDRALTPAIIIPLKGKAHPRLQDLWKAYQNISPESLAKIAAAVAVSYVMVK